MTLFLQQSINGIAIGSAYAIFGLGFGLMFATLNTLNIAHGTLATWGALIALWTVDPLGFPFVVGLLVGVIGAGLIGVLIDIVGFQPLRRRGSGPLPLIIVSIGFLIILGDLALIATNARFLTFPRSAFPRTLYHTGGLVVPLVHVITIGTAVVMTTVLYLFMTRTRLGAAMRAVGWDGAATSLSGVNPRLVVVVTSFLAAALAGLAGVLYGLSTASVSFRMGEGLLLKGFAAVVVGGFNDVRGVAFGGILIGMSETLGAQYISNSYRDAITFGLLILFLLIRPLGIFGKPDPVRA